MRVPLSTGTLARAVGVAPSTIRRLDNQGLLRCRKDFRGWRRFPPDEVDRVRKLLAFDVVDDSALSLPE